MVRRARERGRRRHTPVPEVALPAPDQDGLRALEPDRGPAPRPHAAQRGLRRVEPAHQLPHQESGDKLSGGVEIPLQPERSPADHLRRPRSGTPQTGHHRNLDAGSCGRSARRQRHFCRNADRPRVDPHPRLRPPPDVPELASHRLLEHHLHETDGPHHSPDLDSRPREGGSRRVAARQDLRSGSGSLAHLRVEQAQRVQAKGVRDRSGEGVHRVSALELRGAGLGNSDGGFERVRRRHLRHRRMGSRHPPPLQLPRGNLTKRGRLDVALQTVPQDGERGDGDRAAAVAGLPGSMRGPRQGCQTVDTGVAGQRSRREHIRRRFQFGTKNHPRGERVHGSPAESHSSRLSILFDHLPRRRTLVRLRPREAPDPQGPLPGAGPGPQHQQRAGRR
jgi:hypothetical protein